MALGVRLWGVDGLRGAGASETRAVALAELRLLAVRMSERKEDNPGPFVREAADGGRIINAMDTTTRAVRDMYEAYPYPSGVPEIRVGFDARYVLSLVDTARSGQAPIQVLDAGCGRALGLLGAASLQRDVLFTGVDINRVALAEATARTRERGLSNVQFSEVELTSLQGLDVPAGGFDIIHSSGVIHHMERPDLALAKLAEVLAPHGVIVLMVYGRAGRAGLARVSRAIDALIGRERPIAERLAVGRALCASMPSEAPWQEARDCDDVEFVDRYLHVQETSYDIAGLLELVVTAGLRPLRWCEPHTWSLQAVPPALRGHAEALSPRARWALIDALDAPWMYEIYLTHPNTPDRSPLTGAQAAGAWFAMHPEGTFELRTRALRRQLRYEGLRFYLREREPITIPAGPMAAACLLLRDQVEPFRGADFLSGMAEQGFDASTAVAALDKLIGLEVIFRPHDVDCAQAS